MTWVGARLAALPLPRWLLGVLSAVAMLAAAYVLSEAQGSSAAFTAVSFGNGDTRPVVGAPAPDFVAVDLSGTPIRLSDYRGRPVWMNFWATWCPPCRAELPELQAAYQTFQDRGLVFLAISVGEDQQTVQGYLARTGFTIPALLDEDRQVAYQYALAGFPTHVFIDKDGIVRDIRIGGLNQRTIQERLATILPSS
ncbi:MAG: redoxin domain-containing protein [Chloroflexi bacterium]|nr:redoxin domain-containing protein [Chloroflexota bacterium]